MQKINVEGLFIDQRKKIMDKNLITKFSVICMEKANLALLETQNIA